MNAAVSCCSIRGSQRGRSSTVADKSLVSFSAVVGEVQSNTGLRVCRVVQTPVSTVDRHGDDAFHPSLDGLSQPNGRPSHLDRLRISRLAPERRKEGLIARGIDPQKPAAVGDDFPVSPAALPTARVEIVHQVDIAFDSGGGSRHRVVRMAWGRQAGLGAGDQRRSELSQTPTRILTILVPDQWVLDGKSTTMTANRQRARIAASPTRRINAGRLIVQ